MATATLIPVEEYLRTTYRPDCDFIEGELRERNVGERPHATLQGIFCAIFREHRKQWLMTALPEQRVQTSATHYRIADVCVVRSSDPVDPIVRVPPVVCIEVLSKGDTLGDVQERVDDYLAMGVQHLWIVNPWKRDGYTGSIEGLQHPSGGTFAIPGTPVRIALADVFAEFDEVQTQQKP